MCINRATFPGLRHYYPQCPNIQSDEEYFATWDDWAYKKEAAQQAQWDNHVAMANVNASGAGPFSLYTIRTNRVETTSRDAPRLHESTGLTNKPQSSADFNIEVGDPIQLDTFGPRTPRADGGPNA